MPILTANDRIAIWGFGREGQAALDFLAQFYPQNTVTILNDTPIESASVPTIIGAEKIAAFLASGTVDIVIKSPGISLYRPEIAAAKQHGVRFTSGTNLWFERYPKIKKIGITGTKGKSTTTRVLHHLLTGFGKHAALLGNVGTPLLSYVPAPEDDYAVIELSSYQIADLDFAPDYAIFTSLFPDHAPWHGTTEHYYSDKLRLLSLTESSHCIVNYANTELRARIPEPQNVRWFNRDDGFHAHDNALYYCDKPVTCDSPSLKGEHNLSNIAAACTLCDMIGIHTVREKVDLHDFEQLPHRLQEFDCGGILCVDDSIATIPEATLEAVKVYADKRIVLIIGGTDRGQNYDALFAELAHYTISGVMLLPDTGRRIYDTYAKRNLAFPMQACADLDEAVREAFKLANSGDVILLSPAAPSFGQFRNFEERGDCFKALCEKYKNSH